MKMWSVEHVERVERKPFRSGVNVFSSQYGLYSQRATLIMKWVITGSGNSLSPIQAPSH